MIPTDERDERDDMREAAARLVLEEDGAERDTLERRLAEDPAFAAEVARLRATLDLLPHAAAAPPPAHLRARVMRSAARRHARRVVAPPRRRIPWSALAALAASLVAALLAWDTVRLRRELALERDVARMLLEPNVVLSFQLAGTGEAAGSFGKVTLDLDDEKGAISLQQLPPLPADQVYALWAKVADESVPCGRFRADPDGRVLTQFPVPVDSYTAPVAALFVTVEPKAVPPAPTGPVVMESI